MKRRAHSSNKQKVEECLLYVAWSGLHDPDDAGRGHHERRGEVIADLGLDGVPRPPFTATEMQSIMHATKMEAWACLARRSRKKARR